MTLCTHVLYTHARRLPNTLTHSLTHSHTQTNTQPQPGIEFPRVSGLSLKLETDANPQGSATVESLCTHTHLHKHAFTLMQVLAN